MVTSREVMVVFNRKYETRRKWTKTEHAIAQREDLAESTTYKLRRAYKLCTHGTKNLFKI